MSMNEVHIIYCIALHACMAIDPMRTQTVNRFSACGLVLCCHYLARLFAVAAGAVLPCFWPEKGAPLASVAAALYIPPTCVLIEAK